MNRTNKKFSQKTTKRTASTSGSTDRAFNQEQAWHTSALGMLGYAVAGLISGIGLGLVLKLIQALSGHRVYRLLLNADYVPVLKEFSLSEGAEFGIHLVISVVLCVVLGLLWQYQFRRSPYSPKKMVGVTAGIGFVIGLLLYPTTLLSSGGTPPIASLPAWSWWLLIHAAYGAVSGLLIGGVFRIRLKRTRSVKSQG
ncbi:hypothetical protein [Saccharibacillus sacchari]|uniref:hypothetical protein n=1 Tax=Saccharibacillus sacchari TaxID=456493 RepID=UPI0004B149B1|nr:hypothetical protein [Saccharibacillus sacchari]